MAQTIKLTPAADNDLKKLDPQTRRRILKYLKEHIEPLENPYSIGKKLIDPKFKDSWRYRVGDYRIFCAIEKDEITVHYIGKRDKAYQ